MKPAQPGPLQPRPSPTREARTHVRAGALLVALLPPAAAQDIRGLAICTAEKQIDRRTACLQANAEFLQQALNKLARETDEKSSLPTAILPPRAQKSSRSNRQSKN